MASEIMNGSNSAPWQLGLLTDCRGHIHLGAVFADNDDQRPVYVDLLAPVGLATQLRDDLDCWAYLLSEQEQSSICAYRVCGRVAAVPTSPGLGARDREVGITLGSVAPRDDGA
jgi:hypothetical protein